MSAIYAIDIIECPDPALLRADWATQSAALRRQLGCQTLELFAKDENIREAHYDFLLVSHWNTAWEASAAPGLISTPLFQRDLRSVRLECELIVQLGDYPAAGTPPDSEDDTWLVNPFEIQPEQVPGVLDMWGKAKDYMVAQPGFINARLFRPTEPHPTYNLVNIAQWESRDRFMDALNHQQYDRHREKSQAYQLHPSLCRSLEPGPMPVRERTLEVAS